MKSEARIAFVIDSLPSIGGGEKVLFAALEAFPDADIFTLIYNRRAFASTPIANRRIQTSFLDRLPLAHSHHRLLLPFMPIVVERIDLREYEKIVSFSYAVAHGARNHNGARHLSYTFTPMRYAWTDLNIDGKYSGRNPVVDLYLRTFRKWDRRAASRVHRFAAISKTVSQRIQSAYGREAPIIHPPVEVNRFRPAPQREKYFVTVTRLVPHKRIDIIVQAFSQLGLPLIVIGEGPELPRLRSLAASNIQFARYLSDERLAQYLDKARGFVCVTEEDFGIAMVEAQAGGCPVIAFGRGGALETVTDGITGLFFEEQTAESLIHALRQFESIHGGLDPQLIAQNAARFNKSRFIHEFREFVRS